MDKFNYKSFKKGMGIKVKIPEDNNKNGKQKIRPGIVIKSYASHVELQLFSTVKDNKHTYYSLMINNQKQYVRSIYYKTVPWEQVYSKWFIKNQLLYLSPHNPLFLRIAENKLSLLNDNYQLVHKKDLIHSIEITKDKNKLQELIDWNKDLQEENSKLKNQINNDKNLWKQKPNKNNHENER